jgi:hypothetical protein
MFGTKKSGLRLVATIALATLFVSVGTNAATAGTKTNSKTIEYLSSKFIDGKYLEGFTPGKPDFGFTLEALLQRKALGEKSGAFTKAIRYNLQNSSVVGTSAKNPGYLFNSSGELNTGLAGKFAFTSKALKADNAKLRDKILGLLVKATGSSGDLKSKDATTFDRAWVILALKANGLNNAAEKLTSALKKTQLADGGFNDGYTLDSSATDGTGIALQALASTRKLGNNAVRSSNEVAIKAAVKYLRGTQLNGDHWDAWGDYNTNGTAYASMGIIAAGTPSLAVATWLRSKLASDGGLVTPWSGGSGDVYATAQSVVPMLNLSYLSLIK